MMNRPLALKRALAVCTLVGLGAYASAHPHFNKTITADLPGGVQAVITYNTTPANETRATEAAVGVFTTPRAPKLKTNTTTNGSTSMALNHAPAGSRKSAVR